jgi:hypothetical protein
MRGRRATALLLGCALMFAAALVHGTAATHPFKHAAGVVATAAAKSTEPPATARHGDTSAAVSSVASGRLVPIAASTSDPSQPPSRATAQSPLTRGPPVEAHF